MIAQCPQATLNPETDEPFTHKVILEVFRTRCHDGDPEQPWSYRTPKQKTALTPEHKELRHKWALKMLEFNHHTSWYKRHCIWMDPCHTIIPGRPKTQFDQQQYNYGRASRWMSDGAQDQSQNLRSSPYTNKTTQWGDTRVWWVMILAAGKVHIHVLGKGWHQDAEGQAQVVAELPGIVRKMAGQGNPTPTTLFTDRGPGFYHPTTGNICREYHEALEEQGYTAWAGESSKWQPSDIPDILLHETAVAWVRKFLRQHPIKLGTDMERNITKLEGKLKEAEEHINEHYEVEDLGAQNRHRTEQTEVQT